MNDINMRSSGRLFIIFFLFFSCQKNGIEIEYDESGRKIAEINYKDGKIHGKKISYFSTVISTEETYDNGNRIEKRTYHRTLDNKLLDYKLLKSVHNYSREDGGKERNGPSFKFYKNKQLEEEVDYEKDHKVGKYISYYENGQIKSMGNYVLRVSQEYNEYKSIVFGKWFTFYENGDTASVWRYDDDNSYGNHCKNYDMFRKRKNCQGIESYKQIHERNSK